MLDAKVCTGSCFSRRALDGDNHEWAYADVFVLLSRLPLPLFIDNICMAFWLDTSTGVLHFGNIP